jgi:hypothetical protein
VRSLQLLAPSITLASRRACIKDRRIELRHPYQDDPTIDHDGDRNHYNPNQPRVPAGHQNGGQWTDGNHEPDTKVQLAFAGPGPLPIAIRRAIQGGLLALYAHLSRLNTRYYRTVIEAEARGIYREGAPGGEFDVKNVQVLTQQQVKNACKRVGEIQDLTDSAVTTVKATGKPMSASQYGTEIHTQVANAIGMAADPNFKAELSLVKMADEGASKEELERARKYGIKYGTPGSIRVDALERRDEDTVCVYDIKTGNNGLTHERFAEIFANVRSAYPDAKHIIVTEVRPTDPWRPNPK